jgi:photosystem II stability/assembly factor-like uncharacterized protein
MWLMKRFLLHTGSVIALVVTLFVLSGSRSLAQWQEITFGNSLFWNEVFFVDNDHGWITGQSTVVARTANGGTTWETSFLPGGSTSSNRDIVFVSQTVGFVSGEDGVWKTLDGGVNWINITPPVGAGNTLGAIWFINPNVGVLGFGNCNNTRVTFAWTNDGGANWGIVGYNVAPDAAVGGITYLNGVFYADGGLGKVWSSADGGRSWNISNSGSNGWQEDINSSSGNLLIASANGGSCDAALGGRILRSINQGASWTSTSFPTLMWGVTMYSQFDGWCCGDNGHAYYTHDGGVTWTEADCGMDPNDRVDDIFFTDATHGWAVGDGIYRYDPTIPSIQASKATTLCGGDSATIGVTYRFGNSPGARVQWSPSTGLSCTNCPNPTVRPDKTTTYHVRVSVPGRCDLSDSVTVSVYPAAKVAVAGADSVCLGDSIQLQASGGVSYQWSPSAGLSCTTCANPVVRPTATTTYTVTTYDTNGCKATAKVTVPIRTAGAQLVPQRTLCIGDSLQLNIIGGVAWRWDPDPDLSCDTCNDPVVKPEATTTYRVMIRGANGCNQRDSVTVTVVPLPVPVVTPSFTLCTGGTTQLSASGGVRYRWTPSTGLSCTDCPNPIASPDSTITYTVEVINENGCIKTTSMTVRIRPQSFQLLSIDTVGYFVIDTTTLTHTTCREFQIRNVSTDTVVLDAPTLARNLEFSIPPSQLPIVILPGEDRHLTICFHPTYEGENRDTLTIPDYCPQRIPLKSVGLRYHIDDAPVCDSLTIRIGSAVSGSNPFLKIIGVTPNPVSDGATSIGYHIGRDAEVALVAYDMLGEPIARLINQRVTRGDHTIEWTTEHLPSGVYTLRLTSGVLTTTHAVIVVR